jgi:hypothetical protein
VTIKLFLTLHLPLFVVWVRIGAQDTPPFKSSKKETKVVSDWITIMVGPGGDIQIISHLVAALG